MNLILTRTKQEHTFVWWEPFATSTPLKIVPDNAKSKNGFQKQPFTKIDSVNFGRVPSTGFSALNVLQSRLAEAKHLPSKKARKRKTPGFLVLSSSSDDDDDSNESRKRPVIKLSSKKNTEPLLNIEKPENEETKVINKVGSLQKHDTSIQIKNISYNKKKNSTADLKLKNDKTQNVKNKAKNAGGSLEADIKNDEGGRIFDESKCNKNLVIKRSFKNKENLNHSKSDEKFQHLSIVNKSKETVLSKTSTTSVKSSCKNSSRSKKQKSILTVTAKNYRPSTPCRKGINCTNDFAPLQKTTDLKINEKSAIQNVNLVKAAAPVENKMNLSHQLFSDSKGQECIETLDLTSEEMNDVMGPVKCPLWQKQNFPYKQHYQLIQNKDVSKNNETKHEKPKRKRQEPKQFWMPQNTSDKTLSNTHKQSRPKRNAKTSTKNNGEPSKLYPVTKAKEQDTMTKDLKKNNHGNNKETESVSGRTPSAGRKRKKVNIPTKKNSCALNDTLITCTNETKIKSIKAFCGFSSGSSADTDKEAEPNKAVTKHEAWEKNIGKTVFKQLNELSFFDSKMGISTAECWNVNNFKCGVFKLKAESEFICKTLHQNSHLGGVLVKGTLKMKIQDTELELKEGDMAFVPPLTEWQAINIGTCESLFYYWCGRFK